ncbi:MAG: ATP-binding cassette domain-containing protein [Acidimicrobiia bacterium]
MLRAEDLSVQFGAVRAVDGVSLEVGDGEIVGLVGPNGSGKTTFLNAVCGVVPARGRLEIAGRAVRLGTPRAAVRAGVARVFQAPQTFESLSCIENVLLGSANHRARGLLGATVLRRRMLAVERRRWLQAAEALALVGLEGAAATYAGMLTYGDRRLLDVARALVSSPRVLLLDEPSAGLDDLETAALADLLLRVHEERGLPILVIEHKIDFLDRLCDRVVVLDVGAVIAAGPPDEVWRDERVMTAYLGVSRAEH